MVKDWKGYVERKRRIKERVGEREEGGQRKGRLGRREE
jgi:hypothetical protein